MAVLAVACCAATAPVVLGAVPESPAAADHEGGHCPDSGTDGSPCEPGCLCLCCHAPAQFSPPLAAGVGTGPLPVRRLAVAPADGIRSDGPVPSIFHPPRRLASD
jgi:hypothetical protein